MKENDWNNVDRITEQQASNTKQLVTGRHLRKFETLYRAKHRPSPQLDSDKTVVNLTNCTLSEDSINVLKKGFNFSPAPKSIPTEKLICGLESSLAKLPPEEADEARLKCAQVLSRSIPPRSNMKRSERMALKELREDKSILILPADKGNATVVMDKEDYDSKMDDLLNSGPYIKVNKNPLPKITRRVTQAIRSSSLDDRTKRMISPTAPTLPRIYGLPKIHKNGIPLRPIVCGINSPTYHLEKLIATHLSPLVGNSNSYIRDSADFVKKLKSIRLAKGDIMVSFDVVSLYTNVPVQETLNLIKPHVTEELLELTTLCTQSSYLSWRGRHLQQVGGIPMGSCLSPILANIYMEDFEKRALTSSTQTPTVWYRYVDDTFVIWPHGENSLSHFLTHLNSMDNNIRFTMETEHNEGIAFLDVWAYRKQDGSIGHKVFRKCTHTNRYLHADSHHHRAQKLGVLSTLTNRSKTISDKDNLAEEMKFLYHSLRANGYRHGDILRVFRRSKDPVPHRTPTETEFVATAVLPYIQGVTEPLSRILRSYSIRVATKPLLTLGYTSPKDPLPTLACKGIYKIPCSCGKCYIGQSGRSISIRLNEHRASCRLGYTNRSALAEHASSAGHDIHFEDITVLAKEERLLPRLIREAVEIKKHPNNFNREDGYALSTTWTSVLNRMTHSRQDYSPPPSICAAHQLSTSAESDRDTDRSTTSLSPTTVVVNELEPTD